jgi:hypothetical protein
MGGGAVAFGQRSGDRQHHILAGGISGEPHGVAKAETDHEAEIMVSIRVALDARGAVHRQAAYRQRATPVA